MNRAEIVQSITKAATLREQVELVAELDAFDRKQAQASADGRAIDLAAATVRETLTPVASFEFHTAATDWIGDVETSQEGQRQILAEAALWYNRVSPEVKADSDEFREQAVGFMRREAGRYGEQAQGLYESGIQYLSFLQRQAASGLDQVQQETAPDGVTQKSTPLPTDVFDNFAPEVDPINAGVSGTEDSNRAPLLQEIESAGGGASQPEWRNDDWASGYEGHPNPEPIERTSVALGYVMNMDDFRAQQAHEAASGLDQIEQTIDANNNPKTTPLPTDIMFPWTLNGGETQADDGDDSSAMEKAMKQGSAEPDYRARHDFVADPRPGYSDSCASQGEDGRCGWKPEDHQGHTGSRHPFEGKEGRLDDAKSDECRLCGGNLGPVDSASGKAKCGDCGASMGIQQKASTHSFTEACDENGDGQCDGFDDKGTYCDCACHGAADLPPTTKGVKDWHDEFHGVGKYASKTAAMTHHEMYGPVSTAQLSAYKSHNVPPAMHDELESYFGPSEQSHAAITRYVKAKGKGKLNYGDVHRDQPDESGNVSSNADFRGSRWGSKKTADMFGNSDAPHAVPQPGVANTDTDLPSDPEDTVAAGKADAKAGLAPAVSDGRTHPNYADGYAEGIAEEKAALPKSVPPGANTRGSTAAKHDESKGYDDYPEHAYKPTSTGARSQVCKVCGFGQAAHAKQASLRVSASFVGDEAFESADFTKGYKFAAKWKEGDRMVRQGSAEFEAGLYAGITDNPPAQAAWVTAHKRQVALAERLELHEAFTETQGGDGIYLKGKTAATTTDLDTDGPGTSPAADGSTPINGPGRPGPLDGQQNVNAPAGAAPYNGAAPFGSPVVPTSTAVAAPSPKDMLIDDRPGAPVDGDRARSLAFRKTVQAALLAEKSN